MTPSDREKVKAEAEKWTVIPGDMHPDRLGGVFGYQHARFVEKEAFEAGALYGYSLAADRIARLEAKVNHWEDKRVSVAACCVDHEARIKELEAALKVAVETLEKTVDVLRTSALQWKLALEAIKKVTR